ncbi:hypothetical protein ACWC4C_13850 [Streptomyces olivaceoviridis]
MERVSYRTWHGRVLSLDAALGDGLSLHDLVVADAGYLAHTAGGVFEEERLNTVLLALTRTSGGWPLPSRTAKEGLGRRLRPSSARRT